MRRLASDSVIYGLGSVANQALSFLLLPLYTQYLSPADYGTLALLGAAGGVLGLIVNAGVQSGLTRIFFDYENEDDRAAVVFTALAFTVVTTIAFTVPLYLGAGALTPLLFDPPDRAAAVPLMQLAILIYSLSALNGAALAVLQVYRRPAAYVACSALGLVASLGLTIYLVAAAGRGLTGVLEGQLAGIVLQAGLALAASLPQLRLRLSQAALGRMLAFSVPLLPTNLAAWVLGLADRWFLKEYASFAEVGLYALGFRFGSVLETLFIRPFTLAWFPYLFSILNDPDHPKICARVLEYYTLLASSLVLVLSLFGGDVIRLISDPSYLGAESVIYWIGLGCLLRGMTFVTVAGINIREKTHYSAVVYVAGVAVNVVLLRVLVPRYGTLGAAIAMVVTHLAMTSAMGWIAQRLYPIPYRPLRVGLVVALMSALYFVGRAAAPSALLPGLAVKALFAAAFPGVLLATGFFDRAEIERARALLRRLGARPAG